MRQQQQKKIFSDNSRKILKIFALNYAHLLIQVHIFIHLNNSTYLLMWVSQSLSIMFWCNFIALNSRFIFPIVFLLILKFLKKFNSSKNLCCMKKNESRTIMRMDHSNIWSSIFFFVHACIHMYFFFWIFFWSPIYGKPTHSFTLIVYQYLEFRLMKFHHLTTHCHCICYFLKIMDS